MKRVTLDIRSNVSGSRRVHAAVPLFRNTLGGFLMVLALTAAPAASAATNISIDLAHWVANGGWESTWSVVDTASSSLVCTLNINGPDGKPLSLFTSAGTGSSISFTVPQGGAAQIQAGGTSGSLQTGSSTISCSDAFVADVTYTYGPAGFPVTGVSVLPTGQFKNFVFAANAYTGIAMYNPGGTPATPYIVANDLTGKQIGAGWARVPPGGKITGNLNQLIESCPPPPAAPVCASLPTSFEGRVNILVTDNSMELVALDVLPGANGSFALANVPVVAYSTQVGSFSGTYSGLSGSLMGQTGTFTISGISPVGSLGGAAEFLATATSGSNTGSVALLEMNNGLMLVHFLNSTGFPLAGGAAVLTQTSAGFSGSFYLPGATSDSIARMTLTITPPGPWDY